MPRWLTDRAIGEQSARNIRWLVLDVDGVMTDGTLLYGLPGGRMPEMKPFHVHDGHGIRLWQRSGRHVAVITGRTSAAVADRCADLEIAQVYQGAKVKRDALRMFLQDTGADPATVCYVGDDMVDIPVFRGVGLGIAVADATPETVQAAHLVTDKPGGRGAVREVCEYLLDARGALDALLQDCLR